MRSIVLALCLALAPANPASAQDVTTLTPLIDGGTGGLVVGDDGTIFIGDFGETLSGPVGTRIFEVTPQGDVSVFTTGFIIASGNDMDTQGNIYQSSLGENAIKKVTPDGTVTTFATAGIFSPVGIEIDDANDDLYVCNCGSNTIQKVTQGGSSTIFASGSLFACPNGITFANDGNLYVSNFGNGRVLKITPAGVVSLHATVPGGNNGHLSFFNGDLYVAARAANQIYRVSLDGTVTLFAGTGSRAVIDGTLETASFSLPNDVVVDPSGTYMYVNDVFGATAFDDTAPMVLRRITIPPVVGVAAGDATVPVMVLPARPNPFRSSTRIGFRMEAAGLVELSIFDASGRRVRVLANDTRSGGTHEVSWDGTDAGGRPAAPGVYFYRLVTPDGRSTGRLQRVH